MQQQDTSSNAHFIVLNGPYAGHRIAVKSPVCAIGRDPRCHVQPPDSSVASVHATIHLHDGAYYVKDQGSLRGTYLNNRIVDLAKLADGDVVCLGNLQLQFKEPGSQLNPPTAGNGAIPKQTKKARTKTTKDSANWMARLYSLVFFLLVGLGLVAVLTFVTNLTKPAPPPPNFDPATAAPVTLLMFYADW